MNSCPSRLRGLLAAPLMLLALAACSSAPTRVYTLSTPSPGVQAAAAYRGPAVRVDAVHLPAAFDRLEVVTAAGPGELRINDLAHWPAPLGQLARQTLSIDLIRRLPAGAVIAPHLDKSDDALGLVVDVLQFDCEASGARLIVAWALRGGADTSLSHEGIVTLQTGEGGVSPTAAARSLSALLGMLADRVVSDLTAHYSN